MINREKGNKGFVMKFKTWKRNSDFIHYNAPTITFIYSSSSVSHTAAYTSHVQNQLLVQNNLSMEIHPFLILDKPFFQNMQKLK